MFWATVKVFVRIDGNTVRKLASAAHVSGIEDPNLIEIEVAQDLRSEEGSTLLEQFLSSMDAPMITREDACDVIARFHLRECIGRGDSLACAAFTLPSSCVWHEGNRSNDLWILKRQGEAIYELETGYSRCISQREKRKILDQVEDFEKRVNDLAVAKSDFTDTEIEFMRQLAEDCTDYKHHLQFRFSPFDPPKAYRSALEI